MSSFKDHFTRDKANEGVRVPLLLGLKDTGDWIHVVGTESDRYRTARDKYFRGLRDVSRLPDGPGKEDSKSALSLALDAVYITDWSFDEECTEDNIIEALTGAPQIRDALNIMAITRGDWYAEKKKCSESTSALKDVSTEGGPGG